MSDNIYLLKQKFAIEQQIKKIKNTDLHESKQAAADEIVAKLEQQLAQVNEELGTVVYTKTSEPAVKEAHGHIDPSTYNQEPDHEVQMARSDLYRTAKHAIMLHEILQRLDEKQGLEGWVQAKITKAADYIETVWHYLAYEMRFPYDQQGYDHNESVEEATYGPGEDPNQPQAPGAPQQNPNQAKPGQTSPTPTAGGATPGGATPGMVKMSKMGPDKKPQGTPIMVRATDIASKQKAGYFVIGESKESKVVHCSQCGKGFSAASVDAKYKTGFSHCIDHKGKKVVEEMASAGATSAGGIASSPTGFANGGIGMQRRKKKKADEGTMADAEKEQRGPKFTGYWKGKDKGRPGNKMVGGD